MPCLGSSRTGLHTEVRLQLCLSRRPQRTRIARAHAYRGLADAGRARRLRGPIIIIAQTAQLLPVFEADTWTALTTPGEPAYHPLWAPWIIAELTINLVLLAGSIVVAFLFFAKRRLFPRFMIGFMVASVTVQAFDLLAAQAIPAAAAEIGVQEVRTFLGTLSSSAIWIPYFLRSKRVRATFVKG